MVAVLVVVEMRYAAYRCRSLWTGVSALCATGVATNISADIPTRVPAIGVLFRLGVGGEVDPSNKRAEQVVFHWIHVPFRVKGHAWGGEGGQVRRQLVCWVLIKFLAFLGMVLVLKGQNLQIDFILDSEPLQAIGAQDRKSEQMSHLHQTVVR